MHEDFFKWARTAFRRLHALDVGQDVLLPTGAWLDWARRHRVVGLYAATAPDAGPGQAGYRYLCGQMLHAARLTAEAGRIVGVLRGSVENLRLIKGPALARQAWPDPGLRSFDDLDLRCEARSLDALLAGMQALGYRPEQESPRLRHLWHYGWGIGFRHAEGHHVECNHRIFPPHYPWPARLNGPGAEWQRLNLDGADWLCPGPPLHLMLSCLHVVWHGWERLGWVVDIGGLLARHPGCLAEAEKQFQHDRFARSALRVGVWVADRILGPLPGVSSGMGPETEPARLALALLEGRGPGLTPARRRRMHRRMMSGWEAFGHELRRLATPGDPDFRRWPLPERFRGLYWLLRPLRRRVVPTRKPCLPSAPEIR